ncbi:hypothetical protein C8R45DRAFT_1224211 [Mycena sanguinolenta]|nr:hypothetical protein C8R45DRAFT_1224211 [Mycena sanguinolenta]
MSHYSIDSVDDAPLLDPVTFNWDLRLYRSVVLAGLVLLVYDHTLTLATEVKFIWAAKLRPSIYWFLALRYIGLVANIANCVLYFAELNHEVRVSLFSSVQTLNDLCSEVCVKMQLMWKALIVSQELLVECTLIMRVYAMYDRNRWILICLLAVFAPWPALALWDVIKEGQPQIFSGPGISGCATLGDIFITGFLSWFITSLSITLLARLMLNLHEAAAVGMTGEEPNTIEMETLRFATVQMTVDVGA